MDNPILDDIMKYAAKRLTDAYGYCGVASGPDMAMLNCDDKKGHDFIITIKSKPE
jgi:hypothetical protein